MNAIVSREVYEEKYEKIRDKKLRVQLDALTKNLPEEFFTFMNYARNLKFEETPDYTYLKKLFKDLFYRSGFDYDFQYDWSQKSRALM